MRGTIDKLIWFFSGVFITHVGHFIYQKSYARDFGTVRLSEFIAMIVEDLLQLLFEFLDKGVPMFVAHRWVILPVIALLISVMLFFFLLKIYLRIKYRYQYNSKIKEAEIVLAAAKQQTAGQIKKIKGLQKKMTAEFAQKEIALKGELRKKLKGYIVRIKKLEKEKEELKTINSDLKRKIKTT